MLRVQGSDLPQNSCALRIVPKPRVEQDQGSADEPNYAYYLTGRDRELIHRLAVSPALLQATRGENANQALHPSGFLP